MTDKVLITNYKLLMTIYQRQVPFRHCEGFGLKQSSTLVFNGLLRRLATFLRKIIQCVAFCKEAMTDTRSVIARNC